jgi:hypothetical protein
VPVTIADILQSELSGQEEEMLAHRSYLARYCGISESTVVAAKFGWLGLLEDLEDVK